MSRLLPWLAAIAAMAVWLGPLQLIDWYARPGITDIPTYQRVYEAIAAGGVPYRDFSLEYPPVAAGLFWLAGVLPGTYEQVFGILMMLCLAALAAGVVVAAGAVGLDLRRQMAAGAVAAFSPLLLGNLLETRFDLLVAALIAWLVVAVVTEHWRLMWLLVAVATLTKLIPLVLVPVLIIYQVHRVGRRSTVRGALGALGVVAAAVAPFVVLSASGTWHLVSYHLDRPLQIESTGAAYMLGLHGLAGVPLTVINAFGSQGLSGRGPDAISALSSAVLAVAVASIAVAFAIALRRARPQAEAVLVATALAATMATVLASGKVLSPQFLVWLVPVCVLVGGRYGWAALATTAAAMVMTQLYFPERYFDLVALDSLPIALLVARDTVLIALAAMCWPRASIGARPTSRLISRISGAPEGVPERAVSARYLAD